MPLTNLWPLISSALGCMSVSCVCSLCSSSVFPLALLLFSLSADTPIFYFTEWILCGHMSSLSLYPSYTNLNMSVLIFTLFATFSEDMREEVSCLELIYVLSCLRGLVPLIFLIFPLLAPLTWGSLSHQVRIKTETLLEILLYIYTLSAFLHFETS